ncbi:MAG: hypothetical protein ABIJ56_17030 [Pseudomonadota bacterium]
MADFKDKLKRMLWPHPPGRQAGPPPPPPITSHVINTREGQAKIHIRSLPDHGCAMVVDGHFLVSLNITSHFILRMKLEGKGNDSIRAELKGKFESASQALIDEDIEKISLLLQRLEEEGTRRLAGLHSGNFPANPLSLRFPFRADIELRDLDNLEALGREEGMRMLENLHGWGVISVRFISRGELETTPVVGLVEKTQDMGIISGILMKGREVTDGLLERLLAAGLDYFEIPVFSNQRSEHEDIEGPGTYDSDFEGIRKIMTAPGEAAVIVDFTVAGFNIDNIRPTLELVKRYGVRNVSIGAILVPDALGRGGLGITLGEYEHAVVAVEEAADSLGINYTFQSPAWFRDKNPKSIDGWQWKCTAGENAPSIRTNGDIAPCLHSEKKAGNIMDSGSLWNIPLPIEMLTDTPADEVDYVTLCNRCSEKLQV